MLVTVTLNPCIDRLAEVAAFTYGGMNRVSRTRIDAAGKGVNVAVAYAHLGGESLCTGFHYVSGSELITGLLDAEGIPCDFIRVPGTVRTNFKIHDHATGQTTEINESGSPVEAEALSALADKIGELARNADTLVFSGSVPPGVPADIYRTLIGIARDAGARCVLDAQGEFLRTGIEAGPVLIKPNLFELESTFGVKITDTAEIVTVARSLIGDGVSIVAVTLGSAGAAIVDADGAWYAPAIPIEAGGLCGAGDAAVAGFCRAMEEGLLLPDILRYGVAAATASVILPGTRLCTRPDFDRYLSRVAIEPL